MATNLSESYELLGLPTNATEEEVRKAYKQKARECHPDKNPDDPKATEKFQALRQGYERIVSGSSEEPDNVEYFSGFDSFFHFVMFREMMRRRMREEMMARMFGGVFDDDSDLDEDDFLFGAFGRPFFHRSRHHESTARSNNFRFGNSSYERESSAKTAKKQKDRKKNTRKPSYPDRSGNNNEPKQAQSQGNNSRKQETTFDSDHDETTKRKYGQQDCNAERETYGEERGKPTIFSKSKQRNKNKSQMTSSEWQKGRKSKKNHKKKQTAKCSSSSPFKSQTREENPDSEIESETSVKRGQQFPQQTAAGNRKEQAEHTCSSSPNNEEWTFEDTKTSEDFNGDRNQSRCNSDQGNHFDRAFSFMEYEVNFEDTGVRGKQNGTTSNEPTTERLERDRNSAETVDKPIKHNVEEHGLRKNLNTEKEETFQQQGDKFMFDNKEEFTKTQQRNLSKEEIPKMDNKANSFLEEEECKIDVNIKTNKHNATEREDNYKAEQDVIQLDTKRTYVGHQTDVEKGPLLTRTSAEMKQECQETAEENPRGRQDNLYGTASTAPTNNKASTQTSGVNRVQNNGKERVKPASVKTTKDKKPCNTKSKKEGKEREQTNNKTDQRKMDRSSEKINAGITQTVNAENHADISEQSIPQTKETGLHHGKVCQGGANSCKLDKNDGFFSGNNTDKNKYAGKAKSQVDGFLKGAGKSSLHEQQSDSKETQNPVGNTSNNRNRSEKKQEFKAQETTESHSKEGFVNLSMKSCNNTTENDNMASGCSSNETAKQEFVFERAEPTIAYRKAPLDDDLKIRRPSKHEKRQERRQRRLNELLSGNTWNTNPLSNQERNTSGVGYNQ